MTNDSGNYTCNATASADPPSQFIVPVEGQLRMISITVGKTVLNFFVYHIVPSKRPWVLVAQAPKF